MGRRMSYMCMIFGCMNFGCIEVWVMCGHVCKNGLWIHEYGCTEESDS